MLLNLTYNTLLNFLSQSLSYLVFPTLADGPLSPRPLLTPLLLTTPLTTPPHPRSPTLAPPPSPPLLAFPPQHLCPLLTTLLIPPHTPLTPPPNVPSSIIQILVICNNLSHTPSFIFQGKQTIITGLARL